MLESLVDRAWSCFFDQPKASPAGGLSPSKQHQNDASKGTKPAIPLDPTMSPSAMPNMAALSSPEAVDNAFRAMLADLDVSEERQAELLAQSREWKARMLAERERQRANGEHGADWALEQLRALKERFPDTYGLPLAVQHIEALAASLRTESISWLEQFLTGGGLSLLALLLDQCQSRGHSAELLALPLLGSIRALLNSTIGRHSVQDCAEALRSVAWALDFQSARCKPKPSLPVIQIQEAPKMTFLGSALSSLMPSACAIVRLLSVVSLEILSGLCFCAEFGHRAVLRALSQVTALRGERTRFQRLVDDLHREHGNSARDTERVRLALMSLVNALLKGGAAEYSLEFRVHLRHELVMLGILQVLERIRSEAAEGRGSALDDHIDLFEMMRQEDEHEMQSTSDSGSASPIDFESPAGMAEVLAQRLDRTLALPHFISLLQHLLMVPVDERHLPLWRCFDLLLQQLTLQSAMGGLDPRGADPQLTDPGGSNSGRLDWDDLLARLRTEADCERLERRLREAERELAEERRRALELENRLSDLQDSASLASFSRVSEHSATSSSPSDPCHSPPPFGHSLPPIRPPVGQAPPPPPPSAMQLRSGQGPALPSARNAPKKTGVPRPVCPVKTLNWTPIAADRLAGTVWEDLDEQKYYKQIDIETLSEQFAAGRAGDESTMDGASTMAKGRTMGGRHNEQISVLEPRRAQNCTIMLSRLKMSHREIRQTLLGMDERGRLSRDMLEQMLKFVPGREELQQMREALAQRRKSPQALALADRFLWEMGQIPRFDHRLKCLATIRGFHDRLEELRPGITAISRASTALGGSKRVRQLLALVLAVGNVLNHGKRLGNTFAFTVPSLDQIPSVRAATRADRNLMHFLAEMIERKCPDLLRLKREMAPVLEAARVDRAQLVAELRQLETAIRELAKELAIQQEAAAGRKAAGEQESADKAPEEPGAPATQKPSKAGDRFVPVVRAFLDQARQQMAQLQAEHAEMEEKFAQCARLFGAHEPNKRVGTEVPSTDHLFGPFSRCLNGLTDCHRAIWVEREEAEARKRQTLVRSLFQQRKKSSLGARRSQPLTGTKSDRDFEALVNMLQTGELFSEELSRLRTSVRAKTTAHHKMVTAEVPPAVMAAAAN